MNLIDGFNDRFGHLAGDDVIVFLADYFKNVPEEVDVWVARIGGDEFLVVYYDVPEKLLLERDGESFRITAGIGYAVAKPGEDFRSFLDRVDRNMYSAKRRKEE